jgi:hypothetical protein
MGHEFIIRGSPSGSHLSMTTERSAAPSRIFQNHALSITKMSRSVAVRHSNIPSSERNPFAAI